MPDYDVNGTISEAAERVPGTYRRPPGVYLEEQPPPVDIEVRRDAYQRMRDGTHDGSPDVVIRDRQSGCNYTGNIMRYHVEHDSLGDNITTRLEVYDHSTADTWIIEQRSTSATTLYNTDTIVWRPTVRYIRGAGTATTWDIYHDGWENTYSATTSATLTYGDGWRVYGRPYADNWVIRPEQILRPTRLTPEERARREAEEQRWEALRLEREEERKRQEEIRKIAESKAEKLLLAILTPEQRADYLNNRRFFMQVNGQMFRIDYGQTGNVKRVDPQTREVTDSYCIHPSGRHGCPNQDVMLAQKLMLETNMAAFMKTANHHRVRRGPNDPRYQEAQIRNGAAVAHINYHA